MDNICHTLVGAALAEAGLKRRTTLGAATLMIAANFPDIDIIAITLGHDLGFRRGTTHGVPALIVLPFVLAGLMMFVSRVRRRDGPAPDPTQLVLLSAIGIVTHPVLDWTNTYGMRWLMPFSGRWSYGDALFIIDPWIWITLGAGVWLARRRGGAVRERTPEGMRRVSAPSRLAVALVSGYVLAMAGWTLLARRAVDRELSRLGVVATAVVVDPVPVNPIGRRVIYRSDGAYHVTELRWTPSPVLSPVRFSLTINDGGPLVVAATATAAGREFLSWSRLPFYVV